MFKENDLLKSKQEAVTESMPSQEGQVERDETLEGLERFKGERLSMAGEMASSLERDGKNRFEHANDSLGLSSGTFERIAGTENMQGRLAEFSQAARGELHSLEAQMEAMLTQKINGLTGSSERQKMNVDGLDERVNDLEAASRERMAKIRENHEAEMKSIEEERQRRLDVIKLGGGVELTALELAKKEAQEYQAELRRKFIEEQGGSGSEKSNEMDRLKSDMEKQAQEHERQREEALVQWKAQMEASSQEAMRSLQEVRRMPTDQNEQLKQCQKCGALGTGNFCGSCGAKFETRRVSVCPRCGAESEGSPNFCGTCGSKMA